MKRRGRALRRRYGRSNWASREHVRHAAGGLISASDERASREEADRLADSTGHPWVSVYFPKLQKFHEYSLKTLERTPLRHAHHVVYTARPESGR